MTRHIDPEPGFDPRVADWLESDPDAAPAQVLEMVLASVPSIPQRRALRVPRRLSPMSRFAYLAAAVVAAVGIGFVGLGLLDSEPPAVTPTASPSIHPTPTLNLSSNGLIAIGRDDAILLIDPDTGETVKRLEVPSPLVGDITWAPDGQRFAFSIGDNPPTNGVWVMDISDGTSSQIRTCGDGPDGCSIAWAPDGSRIAVAHGRQLDLIDPDGGNAKELRGFPAWAFDPSWTPDSAHIAVTLIDFNTSGSGAQLWAIDRDGSDLTLLVGPSADVGGAVWSPDGSTLAYLRGTNVRVCPGSTTQECFDESNLAVMSLTLDGSEPRKLSDAGRCMCLGVGPSLGWSPDGASMVLVIPDPVVDPNSDGDFAVFVMSADGSDLRRVLEGYASAPAWQPVP